jgi:Ca-activated chloride channel family protein
MYQPKKIYLAMIGVLIMLALLVPRVSSGAQDPPQPPQPKKEQQNPKDAKDKKGAQRQGAQADDQQLDKEGTIKLDTDLVLLDVSVVDITNNPVFDLKKEDFAVYEDKIQQTIEAVSREEVPLSFGMVIDTSGSMRSKLQIVSDSALDLVKQMRQDDEAFLAQFKAEPELVQDFTTDRRELEDAIGELFTSGGTSLLDAIIATADYAQEKGKRRRKALIVITDGLEKNSSVKEKEVMDALKEDEVQVYLVGFIDEEDSEKSYFGKSPAKKAKDLLTRLADDSGGRAFFPKDVSEMPAIAAQIAKELRTQYVVSYYPTNDKRDGTFRSLKVNVSPKGNRKLIARTRQGYYARNEKGQLPTAVRRGVKN